jgi:hypothetical protein
MKTYQETTNRILEKSQVILEQKSHRRTIAVSCFSVFLLTVAAGAIWGIKSSIKSTKTAENDLTISNDNVSYEPVSKEFEVAEEDDKEDIDSVEGLREENDANGWKDVYTNININELSEEPQCGFYAIMQDSFVEMTRTQLLEHYGIDELDLSKILDGFNEVNNEQYGVYYFGDGTECSSHVFTWENESSSQSISIELGLNNIPLSAPFRLDVDGNWSNAENLKGSEISGINLMIVNYWDSLDNFCYHAEFMINQTGFSIDSQGMGEDDFLKVLIKLISSEQSRNS